MKGKNGKVSHLNPDSSLRSISNLRKKMYIRYATY